MRHEIRLGGANWWGVEGWGRGRREGWGYVTVRKGDGRGREYNLPHCWSPPRLLLSAVGSELPAETQGS